MSRLDIAAAVNRARPLNFSFDGRALRGYEGDTLASALLANGVRLTSRSFKLHRPRGIFTAGLEEPNALVTVGTGALREVNIRATEVELHEGLEAFSQNCWPSPGWDVGALGGIFARFLPAGFYHKTFMWPAWSWYEGAIRQAAGLGRIGSEPDPDRYVKRFHHCELLVVGSGPAGLAAALAAAAAGVSVTLMESEAVCGGSLLWSEGTIEGVASRDWCDAALVKLGSLPRVRILTRTTALGLYDDNFVSAVERLPSPGGPRQRLWKIRARRVVLATGAHERSLPFADNDRPGVMLAAAVRRYLNQYAVACGSRVAVCTNNDSAYATALDLRRRGVEVVAVIDVRRDADSELIRRVRAAGVAIHQGCAALGVRGGRTVRGLDYARLEAGGRHFVPGSRRHLACDLVAVSGGWNAVLHLYSQAGGRLRYDATAACYVPDAYPQRVVCAGAANGRFDLDQALADGHQAGDPHGTSNAPLGRSVKSAAPEPWWVTPAYEGRELHHRQWVDLAHDVSVADIELAVREGFVSVEHMKRYTAAGMAPDQGKTGNINALAVLARATGRELGQGGTTTFRPPYHPVTIGALAGERVGVLAQRYRRLPVAWHEQNGAVLEDHAGWLRAAYYPGPGESEEQAVERETRVARVGVTLFDSSSLGKIEVCGPDAAEFLNRLYVNNVKTLKPGSLRYGLMLNERGIVIDDGVFGCLEPCRYVVNTSSAGARDIHFWMEEWLQCEWPELDVDIAQQTAQWATLTVAGPRSRELLHGLGLEIDLSVDAFAHLQLRTARWCGLELRIRRASFTGECSFELDVAADHSDALWRHLLHLGEPLRITPLGMEALDTLRIEKGFFEVGVDTDGETSPLDLGWGAAIARKTEDFVGRRSLSLPHLAGSGRLQLVGLLPLDPRLRVPSGTQLREADGSAAGHVTSSCASPHLERGIALAQVRNGLAREGELLRLDLDGRLSEARICKPSFYDPAGKCMHA